MKIRLCGFLIGLSVLASVAGAQEPGILTTVTGVYDFSQDQYGNVRLKGGYSGDRGDARQARVYEPSDVAVDGDGNLYIADTLNRRIRRVSPDGKIDTVAGSGGRGFTGDDGPAVGAALDYPVSVAVDVGGNLFIADPAQCRVRKVNPAGIITTVAGSGDWGFSGDGGLATQAALREPYDIAVDRHGNLYIADTWNNRIRKVDGNGIITTVAGSGPIQGDTDRFETFTEIGDHGPATSARLNRPMGVDLDAEDHLYIADTSNARIRKVDDGGMITTVIGTGDNPPDRSRDGSQAPDVPIVSPWRLEVDGADNLIFVESRYPVTLRRLSPSGTLTTIAGLGARPPETENFPAKSVVLSPGGLALDTQGNLYFAEPTTHRVRRISSVAAPVSLTGQPFGGEGGILSRPPDRLPMKAGDLNGGGKLDVADVVWLFRRLFQGTPAPSDLILGDVAPRFENGNAGDGFLDMKDVTLLLQAAIGRFGKEQLGALPLQRTYIPYPGLRFTLSMSRSNYHPGEPVWISSEIENNTEGVLYPSGIGSYPVPYSLGETTWYPDVYFAPDEILPVDRSIHPGERESGISFWYPYLNLGQSGARNLPPGVYALRYVFGRYFRFQLNGVDRDLGNIDLPFVIRLLPD